LTAAIGADYLEAGTLNELIELLKDNKVDLIILPKLMAEKYVTTHKGLGIFLLNPHIEYIMVYHYLNKKYAKFAKKLEKILKKMLYQGVIHKIREDSLKSFHYGPKKNVIER